MPALAGKVVALLDANVLYPFLVRDILLSLADAGLYQARWTGDIVAEWTRTFAAKRPEKRALIERTAKIMATRFPESLVVGYEALIPKLNLPDPGDRHVLAAAIVCEADVIVTWNERDFPADAVGCDRIQVQTPDDFILQIMDASPTTTRRALRTMRLRYRSPPYAATDLLRAMERAGLVDAASNLSAQIEDI